MPRRPDDYGRILPTHAWQGRKPRPWWQRWFAAWRWWLLAALLIAAWYWVDAHGRVDSGPKGTRSEVSAAFHACGASQGPNCVVDGDTFIIGTRHIRIVGIDAPEIGTKARCPAEALLANAARDELLRLLNQGAFTLQPPEDGLRDEYGRELMTVTRTLPDGSRQDVARALVESGKVRDYPGGPRQPWC
jgi:endonuclease YncB( thermonuclease family)